MGIETVNQPLRQAMCGWVHGCVILVDETTTDENTSGDRDACHDAQKEIIAHAGKKGIPLYLVQFHLESNYTAGFQDWWEEYPASRNLGETLKGIIPDDARVFGKSLNDTDGFVNAWLVEVTADKEHVVIMGQSVNACCAATARGAKRNDKQVHTAAALLRGGGTATTAPGYSANGSDEYEWPDGTQLHTAL